MEGRKGSKMTRKQFWTAMAVIIAVMAAIVWVTVKEEQRQTWDTEHPMVNTEISWGQTWHAGAWGDAG